MSHWLSIEIMDGPYAARLWADAHGDALVEAAISGSAIDWDIKRTAWGVVFEVNFNEDAAVEWFKNTEAVRNALHTAPDPHTGVIIYRGRSLDAGPFTPRKPKPKSGSGSAALPLPINTMPFLEPLPAFFSNAMNDRRSLTTKR